MSERAISLTHLTRSFSRRVGKGASLGQSASAKSQMPKPVGKTGVNALSAHE
jgi:hypothetical protein